jgi:hypothetical protein
MMKRGKEPKRNIYKLPEGFFEEFPEDVMARISNEKQPKIGLFRKAIAIAASLALIVGAIVLFKFYSESHRTALEQVTVISSKPVFADTSLNTVYSRDKYERTNKPAKVESFQMDATQQYADESDWLSELDDAELEVLFSTYVQDLFYF